MTRALLVASGLVFLFGATAGARTAPRQSRSRTLATLDVPVNAVAQNGRRIALIMSYLRCGNQVRILTLPERRPIAVGSRRGRSCGQRPMHTVAVAADGRAVWQAVPGAGNTVIDVDLYTAALGASATHIVAGIELFYNEGDPDHVDSVPLPVAADGDALVFYARCDVDVFKGLLRSCGGEGAIYRLVGLRARLLTRVPRAPVGVAVDNRRVAAVTNNVLCCNDTPVWSHDGTRFAWIHRGDLWTIHADGTSDRRLATRASLPSWSPDDAQLVFEREEGHKQRVLHRVDASGRGLERLAAGRAPAWSPDGTRIAFIRGKDVYAIDPAGRFATKLT
jgi:WD40-like Beta Propeller Repeat